jgi:hypothetical protein
MGDRHGDVEMYHDSCRPAWSKFRLHISTAYFDFCELQYPTRGTSAMKAKNDGVVWLHIFSPSDFQEEDRLPCFNVSKEIYKPHPTEKILYGLIEHNETYLNLCRLLQLDVLLVPYAFCSTMLGDRHDGGRPLFSTCTRLRTRSHCRRTNRDGVCWLIFPSNHWDGVGVVSLLFAIWAASVCISDCFGQS